MLNLKLNFKNIIDFKKVSLGRVNDTDFINKFFIKSHKRKIVNIALNSCTKNLLLKKSYIGNNSISVINNLFEAVSSPQSNLNLFNLTLPTTSQIKPTSFFNKYIPADVVSPPKGVLNKYGLSFTNTVSYVP